MVAPMASGGRPGDDAAAMAALQARIDAVRAARAPKRNPGADKFNAAALAWRMVTELVVGVLLGAGIGWGLDSAIGTLPLFLIIFTLFGFAAGVKTLMRSAEEMRRRDMADQAGSAPATDGRKVAPAPDGRMEFGLARGEEADAPALGADLMTGALDAGAGEKRGGPGG